MKNLKFFFLTSELQGKILYNIYRKAASTFTRATYGPELNQLLKDIQADKWF